MLAELCDDERDSSDGFLSAFSSPNGVSGQTRRPTKLVSVTRAYLRLDWEERSCHQCDQAPGPRALDHQYGAPSGKAASFSQSKTVKLVTDLPIGT